MKIGHVESRFADGRMKSAGFQYLALMALSALAERSIAAPIPPVLSDATPPGLQAGDRFQLLFVTRDVRDADSSDIADFNAFVNSVADSAGIGPAAADVHWFVVASTADVDARDNALVQAPVYNMQGELLAADYADMWDGALAHAVNYDEQRAAILPFHFVWTGSRSDGTGFPGRELGGFPTVESADLKRSDPGWIANSNGSPLVELHLYALSEPLFVVPEPSTLAIQSSAMLGLLAVVKYRRRR
jgi:hypothetical protein